jgi:hypothetical protein
MRSIALSDSLEAGDNKKARQEILDSIADFAKADPALLFSGQRSRRHVKEQEKPELT